ncbi:hypothetical protein [Kitasatospora sp. NPDC001683]
MGPVSPLGRLVDRIRFSTNHLFVHREAGSQHLAARRSDMIQVVGFVDRRVQSWFASVERVHEVVKVRPEPDVPAC